VPLFFVLVDAIPPDVFREAIRLITDGVMVISPQGKVLLANVAAQTVFRITLEAGAVGTSRLARVVDEHGNTMAKADYPAIRAMGGETISRVILGIEHDHAQFQWLSATAAPVRDADGNITAVIVTGHDVTELKSALAEVRNLSLTDALTGLRNRRGFEVIGGSEHARAQRSQDTLTLAMIDVDGLKVVNDQQGHEAGDALLRRVAATLLRSVRSVDIVSRLGGDEFALLLTGPPSHETLLSRLRDNATVDGVSFSVGTCNDSSLTMAQMMAVADAAMYAEKQARRALRRS
jgi:diguanylate cyclase (GGDEF)-like protein